jgi:hypothetical protein
MLFWPITGRFVTLLMRFSKSGTNLCHRGYLRLVVEPLGHPPQRYDREQLRKMAQWEECGGGKRTILRA